MTRTKKLRSILVSTTLSICLAGCAASPIAHPNLHEANEHLSDAQELLTRNHPGQAIVSVKEALKRHRLANDLTGTIDDMNRLARLNRIAGNMDHAMIWVDKALVLEAVSDHPVRKIETLLLAAETAMADDQPSPWLSEAGKQISLLQNQPSEKNRLTARYDQINGLFLSSRKEYKKAIEFFKMALDLDRAVNNGFLVASDLANLGRNYFLIKDYREALDSFNKAYEIDRHLHNPTGVAFDLEGISLAQTQNGSYRKAARTMLEASGVQMGLGRTEAAKKDIAFAQSILGHLQGIDPVRVNEVLSHWFEAE